MNVYYNTSKLRWFLFKCDSQLQFGRLGLHPWNASKVLHLVRLFWSLFSSTNLNDRPNAWSLQHQPTELPHGDRAMMIYHYYNINTILTYITNIFLFFHARKPTVQCAHVSHSEDSTHIEFFDAQDQYNNIVIMNLLLNMSLARIGFGWGG